MTTNQLGDTDNKASIARARHTDSPDEIDIIGNNMNGGTAS